MTCLAILPYMHVETCNTGLISCVTFCLQIEGSTRLVIRTISRYIFFYCELMIDYLKPFGFQFCKIFVVRCEECTKYMWLKTGQTFIVFSFVHFIKPGI